MSVFSTQIGNAAQAVPSGKTPIDDLYAKLTVGAAVFFVTLEVALLVHAGWPPAGKPWLDAEHYVFGRDFINTWLGGRSLFFGGPAPWFDARFYNETVRQMMGEPYPEVFWSYPPHIVLFAWPFGFLPYLPAYVAWCVIGIALYLFVARRAIPRERLMFLAVAPSIAVCVFFGQNGFYTAALLIGGVLCLDRRPVLAGILFGLLTIKPQLGPLLPVMLLLERRWVTIASAIVTTAVLVVATAMLFGWSVWTEYLEKIVPQQAWLTEHGGDLLFALVGSVYFGARLIHLPASVDWAVQGIACAFAFAGVVWTYWRRRDQALSFAFFATAIFLFTPYILNYDMVILGFVVASLRGRDDNTMADHWLLIAVWTLPITMMIAAVVKIPLAPIVLIPFACRLLWRLRQDGRVVASLPGQPVGAVA
jgi:alpha-1,2-mannosyltransferase